MFIPIVTYVVLAVSGVIASAIAWEDLRNTRQKPKAKKS